ncbi:MAG: TonB-dependent receptor [Terriglobia bacterium]|nr:TonB-dependent receptor [Terriglobia bacterium]
MNQRETRAGKHLQEDEIGLRVRGKHLSLILICVTLFLGFAATRISAQITMGGVAGTVKDQTGAVVKGAKITLTNQATQVVQTTQSTSTGTYVFSSVPVGTYTLRADAPGFKTYVDTGIQIHVQNIVTADVPLQPGAVRQQVTVTSAIPLLQAQDASLGQTVPSVQINDLPLNGRNWLSLTNLSAGAYAATNSSPDNPSSINVNGVSQNQVDFRLNGIDNNVDVFNNQAGNVAPVPDAIEEFKLQAGNNSAEFGQFTGSVVNAVVKSGTNHLNGDLWEYLRNEALNANDYFNKRHDTPRQKYRQNQFGGTVGGPVMIPGLYDGKNKTFFFLDYQHTGITQQAQFTDTVPTNGMRNSNFTNLQDLITGNSGSNTDGLGRKFSFGTVLDPATTRSVAAHTLDPISGFTNTSASTVYVRDPFYTGGSIAGIQDFTGLTSQLNIIPQGRIDPNAVKLLQSLPASTAATGLINNYFTTPSNVSSTNQYDVRIDENISPKDLVWGVFSRSVFNAVSYQPFPGVAGGALQISPNDKEPHYELALNYTHVFSPEMENSLTGGYDHDGHFLTMPTANTLGIPAQFGIQGIPQIAGNGGLPTIDYNGFTSFGGRRYMPTLQTTSGLQFMDNLMKVHGNHEFNVGFNFNHIRAEITQPSYSKGEFGSNGEYSNIPNKNNNLTGIADLLLIPTASTVGTSPGVSNYLGGLSSYTGSNFAATDYFTNYYAGYAQDNWRPTSTLTLNLGIRWEYFAPYGESYGRQANFIAAGGNGSSGTYYIPQKGCGVARSATFNALLSGYNIQVDCVSGLQVNKAQKTNFAPRLGFAYRVRPSLVVRGAYGISYGSYDSVGYGSTLGTNYPFQYQISNPPTTSQTSNVLPNGQTATIENTFGVINLQDPSTVTGTGLALYGKQYDYKTPYVQSANLTVQDQFTNRDSIQVGYVGSLGRNLDAYGKHNAPSEILPPGVNESGYVPFKSLAVNAQFLQTISLSNYNSLQTTYQHQFKNNLVLLANYTYGKCMSDDGGSLSSGFRAEWLPNFGIGKDYTLCNNDATHVVHVSGEYELPLGKGRSFLSDTNKWVDALIGGWYFNYIYTYQSGQPFTVGCPTATTSDFGCNANRVPGQNPYAGPHNVTQWLNPNAFAKPPAAVSIGQTDYSPLGGGSQQVRGPGFYNLDSSVFKTFSTGKGTTLQFRVETFNTFNHAQFSNPGQLNFTNLKNFSNITGTRNTPRLGQLALKLFF